MSRLLFKVVLLVTAALLVTPAKAGVHRNTAKLRGRFPAKAGIQPSSVQAAPWTPAFAGETDPVKQCTWPSVGKWHEVPISMSAQEDWIPACAGMTVVGS